MVLNPAQGALHTSADAEEDAVVCLAPWLLLSSCPVVFHFFLKMSKDPLVFSEKIKSVLITHSLSLIKINQQINIDFYILNYFSRQVLTFLVGCCFNSLFTFGVIFLC